MTSEAHMWISKAVAPLALVLVLAACTDEVIPTTGLARAPKRPIGDLATICTSTDFAPVTDFPTGPGFPVRAAVGDFNHDAHQDIVVSVHDGGQLSVFLGDGRGGFGSAAAYAAGVSRPTAVAVGDFNNDGNLDIVTGDVSDPVLSVLLGNGDGTFGPPRTFPVGPGVYMIANADFNHDGNLDVAVATYPGHGPELSVLLGDGHGGFAPVRYVPVGGTPITVQTADFNGDGVPDLLVGNVESSSGNATILLGNGDGTFRISQYLPPGYTLSADINNDGIPDILLSRGDANATSVTTFLGRGDGTFAPADSLTIVGGNPSALALADFDGDGKLDLAGSTAFVQSAFVWPGDGTGRFGSPVYFNEGPPTTGSGFPLIAADVNGDGRPDLITPLYFSTSFALLLNDGPRSAFLVNPLFDQTKTHHTGSVIPIKLQLFTCEGANASSSGVAVHAKGVQASNGTITGPADDAGNANPDSDFRYDPTLGGYIFNFAAVGMSAGSYNLLFTAGTDTTRMYQVGFAIR